MRKSLLKLLGVVAALTLSTCVSAIGMGGIKVVSALGQPLKAEIELMSVKRTDKTSLVARLASPDVYRGAGLEYPYGNKFKFQIETRANGSSYIAMSSVQPVNDPFVSMLVELTWASGKLLREYTFLLDPPGYTADQPKPAEVQPLAPIAPAEDDMQSDQDSQPPQEQVEPVRKPYQPPIRATAPVDEKALSTAPARKQVASVAAGDIKVVRGDTLSRIARQNKPAEVSLERMLVALYRANADQFDGQNMNRIRAGKILRMPDQDELMNVSQSEAVREIRAQTADWNVYRQKLAAAASVVSQQQEAQQVATGKIDSSVADKTPVAKESAREVLKLSKGEAPGDKATAGATGKPMTAQEKKNAEQEDAIASEKALKEDQARAALLEKNLKDMERLAKLKSEAAALAAQPSAPAEAKPAPVAKPKKPKPKPQPVVVEQPSLVDQILDEPLYLGGILVILLGLGGVGFMLKRRKQATATFDEPNKDAGEITGHMAQPVAPSPDTGDFTSVSAEPEEDVAPADEVDPIAEADLFLNFGRDAQAEEILKEALRNTPDNHQIHLKLLGIYANRKDVNAFSSIAQQLKDTGDEEAWQQAAAMGRALEPNNPMYGGTGSIEDTGSMTMQTTVLNAMPDFVLDEGAEKEDTTGSDIDFDLGEPEKTADLSEDDAAMADAEAMDFDITSTSPEPTGMDFDITSTSPSMPAAEGGEETGSPNLDDLVFDVTSTHPSMPAAQPEGEEAEKPAQDDDGGMEFTLDFPIDDADAEPASGEQPQKAPPEDIGLAGISLNLDDVGSPEEPSPELSEEPPVESTEEPLPEKDEHWHDVATKLDLAKAYQEMGDMTGAREILEEVLREGDEGQREAAQAILDQIG